ncbi:hypothetical protein B0H16DRAFT_1718259 [Mycena metata]|uniref:Uncharacterized protein n=1 Tax=Mycena metata TaxID=1033252 RepID=A0AAD7JIU1_9AGAR|nr:hypothetical protein B0H16DRAFT_1718259 [Mycena metata]
MLNGPEKRGSLPERARLLPLTIITKIVTTKTHRALEIAELVEMICFHAAHGAQLNADRNRDMLSLESPDVFGEPALDLLLWEGQDGIINVLKTMADDLWKVDSDRETSVRALRPIKAGDWARFHVYARRVKLLLWIGYSYSALETGSPVSDAWSPVFALLAETLPVEHIFPNLKELFWRVGGRDYLTSVNLFLAPRLETIYFGDLATDAHLAILPTLSTRCPCLTRIQQGPHFLPLRAPTESSKFPSLREIGLASTPYVFVPAFFALNETWTLRHISMTTSSAPSAAETAGLYALVAGCCDHTTLGTLKISSSVGTIPAAQIADSVITPDGLRPLFCFRNLRRIDLYPPAGLDLDDTTVADLARAWSKVKSMHLGGGAYRRPPSRVTLAGIRALARKCHQLQFLGFPFNASIVPDDAPPAGGNTSQVLWFEVYDTPLLDPATVAAYLSKLFPRLRKISTAAQVPLCRLRT